LRPSERAEDSVAPTREMDLRSSAKGGAGRREAVPAPETPAKVAVRSRTSDTTTNLLLGIPAELLRATLRLLDNATDLAALACAAPRLRAAVEVRVRNSANSPLRVHLALTAAAAKP
jgi:hypothetical protein